MPGSIRVAIGLPAKTTDEHFILAKQMGCEEVVLATPADLPGTERWEYEDLARLRQRVEGFGLARQIANDSPAWGLLFCVGCWSEMGGNANVIRGIRHFGPKNQIVYVHFRGVEGEGERFNECFIGEGPLDVTGIVRELMA